MRHGFVIDLLQSWSGLGCGIDAPCFTWWVADWNGLVNERPCCLSMFWGLECGGCLVVRECSLDVEYRGNQPCVGQAACRPRRSAVMSRVRSWSTDRPFCTCSFSGSQFACFPQGQRHSLSWRACDATAAENALGRRAAKCVGNGSADGCASFVGAFSSCCFSNDGHPVVLTGSAA